MFKWFINLCLVFFVTLQTPFAFALANSHEPIKIGILAYRPKPETLVRWKPLELFLKTQIPERDFIIKAYTYSELNQAVASRQIEFVLTNPSHYIYLKELYGLSSPLASLVKQDQGHLLSAFGGVIFSLADRSDINHLSDLAHKRVAFTKKQSLGGYQMQSYELYQAGISIDDKYAHMTGMPHDNVVQAVINKQADVGFVRTGVLEALQTKQGLDLSRLKIINAQNIPSFPFRLSTHLYPEWPIAALPHIDRKLASHFTAVLLLLHDDNIRKAIGIDSFIVPIDYSPVEKVLRTLRAAPFEAPPSFTLYDIWHRYALQLCIMLVLVALIIILSIYLLLFNHRLSRQRQEITEEARKHHTLLSALAEGVYGVNNEGLCTFINPTALKLLGYTEAEILGKDPHSLFHHHRLDQSHYPEYDCPITKTLLDGQTRHNEDVFWRKDGSPFAVVVNIAAIQISAATQGAVVVFRDVSQEKDITERNKMLVTALEAAQISVVITDIHANIEWVNPAFEKLTGYSHNEVIGQPSTELVTSDIPGNTFYSELWRTIRAGQPWKGEIINRRKDGSLYNEELNIAPVTDNSGKIQHFIAVKNDISKRKRFEKHIQYLAQHDTLTGLPNRTLLSDRLAQALTIARRNKTHLALMFLDLDKFKPVNDNYGHAVGDVLLKKVAQRIKSCLRESDTVARVGGDEFIVLLPTVSDASDALKVAEKIRHKLNKTFHYQEYALNISSSTGIAIYPQHGDNEISLAKNADFAMYYSKEHGRNNVQLFQQSMLMANYSTNNLQSSCED